MTLFWENIRVESLHFDPSFPHTPPELPDIEISLIIKTDAPVINNFDEFNEDECFDPVGGEIDVEDDDSFHLSVELFSVSHLPAGFSFTSLHRRETPFFGPPAFST
ncbi:hypothetical protein Tco_0484522 [Tanacetum coccineum]